MLFGDPLEGIETDEVGYRGPIACSAAGITYRWLDYWGSHRFAPTSNPCSARALDLSTSARSGTS